MKYLYLILFSLIAVQFSATAQRNFKPGYIVTLNGDTTKGIIDYKEWNQNPGEITFKTTEQAAAQQYSPDNIKAFGIDHTDHYQKYTGPITTGTVDLGDLSSGIDSSFTTAKVFLRILTSGKNLTLYNYKDKIKTRYFIADKNSAPVELRRYVYLDNKQQGKIREYNFYTQQLLAFAIKYAPDNTALTESINKVAYRATDLEAVILKFNGNINKYNTSSESGSGTEFFIGVGANMTNAAFTGTPSPGSAENIFYAKAKAQSVRPLIAGGIDFFFNKSVKKLFFRAEVNLTINKINATHHSTYIDYINKIERDDEVTLNQTNVAFNPQLVYNVYNTNNLKFFVAAGLQLNFSLLNNKHYYVEYYLNGKSETKQDRQYLYRYKTMTTTLTAKTGVTLANKFNIYLGYGAPVSIIDNPNYGIDLATYQVGINYLFGKK